MEFRSNCFFVFLLLISSQCFGMKKIEDKSYGSYLKSFFGQRDDAFKEIQYFGKFDDFSDRFDKIDKEHEKVLAKFKENEELKKRLEEEKKKNEELDLELIMEKKNGTFYKNATTGIGAGVAIYGAFKLYGYLKKN